MVAEIQRTGQNAVVYGVEPRSASRSASTSQPVFSASNSSDTVGDSITITYSPPQTVYAQAPLVTSRRPARVDTPRLRGMDGAPINCDAAILTAAQAEQRYGQSRELSVATGMLSISDADNSYQIVTNGKDQSWCADGANYFYEQLTGSNPFGRRLSGVSSIKSWGIRNKIYHSARSPQQIARQMANIDVGDVIVFRGSRYVKAEDNNEYPLGTASHVGVVVGKSQDRLLLVESNTNSYKMDPNSGKYLINYVRDSRGRVIGKELCPIYTDGDRVLLKEYGPNEFYCSGYSGYVDMQSTLSGKR